MELLLLPLEGVVEEASVVVKKTYSLAGARFALASPEPLVLELPIDRVGSDLPFKRATDVVAIGSAYAADGRPFTQHRVRISAGEVSKNFRVFGRRAAEWKDERNVSFSEAEPVESVPLTVEHAYGGVDGGFPEPEPRDLEGLLLATSLPLGAYPRNVYGKGFALAASSTRSTELPQVEDPDELLRPDTFLCSEPAQWHRQPLPWFAEWQWPGCFPRAWFVGVEPRHVPPTDIVVTEVRRGFISQNWREWFGRVTQGGGLPVAFFQEAALGQTIHGLSAGSRIVVEGMSPEMQRLEFTLPEPPRIEIEIAGEREAVAPRILNIVLKPHEACVMITWEGGRSTLPRRFLRELQVDLPVKATVDGTLVHPSLEKPFWEAYREAQERADADVQPATASIELGLALGTTRPRRERGRVANHDALRVADVDLATGGLLLEHTDWVLEGSVVPFSFRRHYRSSMIERAGSLGAGWSHCLEQEVWEQDNWIMYRMQDGREVGIPSTRGELGIASAVRHPIAGVTIHRTASDAYEVRLSSGRRFGFSQVAQSVQAHPVRARLTRIWGEESSSIEVQYDPHGRLDRLLLPSGQSARFEHDSYGRLTRIFQPSREDSDWIVAARYEFDASGQLGQAVDGANCATKYRYRGNLLTQATLPSGLVRRFTYDGAGPRARIVKENWGEDDKEREYFFNPKERVGAVTEPNGGGLTVHCDEAFRIIQVLDAFANETARTYDEANGLLSSQTTRSGETSYLYDAEYHLADVSAPDQGSVALEHDDAGHLVRWTDADGESARWAWDQYGRLSAAVDRAGSSTLYEYADQGALKTITPPCEACIVLARDPQTQAVVAVESPTGARTARHDALSRIVSVADELSQRTSFRYDPCGRVTSVDHPGDFGVSYESDQEGRVLRIRDRHSDRKIARDPAGAVTSVTNGDAGPQLHLDAEGRVRMFESEALEYWELVRDAAGRVQQESGFGEHDKRYVLRDHNGLVTRAVRAATRTMVKRDKAGRPVELEHSDETFQRYGWTKAGHLARALNADRTTEFERDGEGRITLEKRNDGHWVKSTYGALGRRDAWQSSLGLSVRVERDVLGNAMGFVAQRGEQRLELRFERDACGREVRRQLPGKLSVRWTRDGLGRATERAVMFEERTLSTLRFTWAGLDRLERVEDPKRGTRDHRYDARGRLIQVGGAVRVLDEVGNVFRSEARDDHKYASGGRLLETYGIQYRYDKDGRRSEKETPDGSIQRYRYDPLARLIEVSLSESARIVYDYDGLGRLVRRSHEEKMDVAGLDEPVWEARRETQFVWDGLELLHETDGDRVTSWLWERGQLVGKIEEDGAYAAITDANGMPTELTAEKGNLVWRASVDLFGMLHKESAQVECPWRFAGHWEDPETGLLHSWLRVYDPETGAYLVPNPLGVIAGANLYAYVDDPVVQASPLGLGRGYETLAGAVRSERLEAELIERFVKALDREDGAAGPRSRFDADAAVPKLPDPEAILFGPWESYRPSRRLPPPTSFFTRLPETTRLVGR